MLLVLELWTARLLTLDHSLLLFAPSHGTPASWLLSIVATQVCLRKLVDVSFVVPEGNISITRRTAPVVPVHLVLQTMASTFFLHVHAADVMSLHLLRVSPNALRVLTKPSLHLALCSVHCVLLAFRRSEIPAKPRAAPSVDQDYIRHCRVPPPATTALLDMLRR